MAQDRGMTGRGLAQLKVGDRAQIKRLITANDLVFYSHAVCDLNPLHLPDIDGDGDGAPEALAPFAWLAGLMSGLIGSHLPGPGSREIAWTAQAGTPTRLGDTVTVSVEVTALTDTAAVLSARVDGPDGVALSAEITVAPPAHPRRFEPYDLPGLMVRRHPHFERLLSACDGIEPAVTMVVCPHTEDALAGALAAAERKLITPVLVGDPEQIRAAALECGADLSSLEIVEALDARAAAAAACRRVADGQADSVMKGHLHTDTLLRAVLDRAHGLRGDRRLSHVFVMDVPGEPHLLFVTDAAVNITPDLAVKVDIVQNAIDLARALGIAVPKVGILSAVETVNPALPSTLDAAALSKMAERGQITGGLVDGPLAMDNAVDLEAARVKGLKGEVAGRADILVAPNLEAGNMLAKQLSFVAHAQSAGVVLGARAPVILTSRADSEFSRVMSCAVAALHARWMKTGAPAPGLSPLLDPS
jgi:phosphate butyryltransferase